jgi:hypothetical protein
MEQANVEEQLGDFADTPDVDVSLRSTPDEIDDPVTTTHTAAFPQISTTSAFPQISTATRTINTDPWRFVHLEERYTIHNSLASTQVFVVSNFGFQSTGI